jgi:Tfp pilus assembly protein FimV
MAARMIVSFKNRAWLTWRAQAEGEALSRKNGELEATMRKLRGSLREAETERERAATRLASAEAALGGEQERAVHATQAAAVQVGQGCCCAVLAPTVMGIMPDYRSTHTSACA